MLHRGLRWGRMMIGLSRGASGGLLAVLCVLGATPGHSQAQQTPDGAISFLKLVAAQGSLKVDIKHQGKWNPERYEVSERDIDQLTWSADGRTISGFDAMTRCRFLITTITPPSRVKSSTGQRYRAVYTPLAIPPTELDLSRVSQIEAGTSDFLVFVNGASPEMRFQTATADLRARVTFALDFLRQRCDPTAATGF